MSNVRVRGRKFATEAALRWLSFRVAWVESTAAAVDEDSRELARELPRRWPREPYRSRFTPAAVHGARVAPTSDLSRVPALLPHSRRPSRHRCFPAAGGHRNRAGLTDSAAGAAYFTGPQDRSYPHLKSLYLGVSCLKFYSGPIDSQSEAAPLEDAELLGCRLAGV